MLGNVFTVLILEYVKEHGELDLCSFLHGLGDLNFPLSIVVRLQLSIRGLAHKVPCGPSLSFQDVRIEVDLILASS